LKSSAISSQKSPPWPTSDTPPRNGFALGGPSVALDPRTNAVRADLADVRLADRVFAPHYAAPMPMTALADSPIRATTADDGEVVDTLAAGDVFDVLEIASVFSWGQARDSRIVGYVANAALAPARDGAAPA
jgi:hypothetical protein